MAGSMIAYSAALETLMAGFSMPILGMLTLMQEIFTPNLGRPTHWNRCHDNGMLGTHIYIKGAKLSVGHPTFLPSPPWSVL